MPDKEDTQRDGKPVPDQVTVRGDAAILQTVADALRGRALQAGVRGFVIPADAPAYAEALDNGALAALHAAGFVICAPGTLDPALAPGEFGMNLPAEGDSAAVDAALGT
jgi:hypothetical protein